LRLYPINNVGKETSIIPESLRTNVYLPEIINILNLRNQQSNRKRSRKYIKFTKIGREKVITQLFKHTKEKVSFQTNNLAGKLLRNKNVTWQSISIQVSDT
jgi:Leucine-rich repeat (LRR) protein